MARYRKIGERVRKAREKRGWSRHEVEKRTNGVVKRQSLINLEEGIANPYQMRIDTAMSIIDVFWPEIRFEHFRSRGDERRCERNEK